jgi:hypothetical protein
MSKKEFYISMNKVSKTLIGKGEIRRGRCNYLSDLFEEIDQKEKEIEEIVLRYKLIMNKLKVESMKQRRGKTK